MDKIDEVKEVKGVKEVKKLMDVNLDVEVEIRGTPSTKYCTHLSIAEAEDDRHYGSLEWK